MNGADGSFYGSAFYDGANGNGTIYALASSPALRPDVLLTLSADSVMVGTPFTLSYSVANGHNAGSKYCFATAPAGASGWSGVLQGAIGVQTATLTAPATAGTYTYALTCGGGQESGFATLTVTAPPAKATTATTLGIAKNPVKIGQTVTFAAAVAKTAGTGVPTGSINFSVGNLLLASVPVNAAGVAMLEIPTTGIPANSYPILASYSGDSTDSESVSPPLVVMLKNATATTLAASTLDVTVPSNVTFTATVRRPNAAGAPTGSVTFYYGAILLTTVNLNSSGVAAFTVNTNGLPAATYTLTSKYNGSGVDAGSGSGSVSVVVQ
jgi:uncharacterized repeat protein (TIGR03803 family)